MYMNYLIIINSKIASAKMDDNISK